MGEYFFYDGGKDGGGDGDMTASSTAQVTKVEFTFGYRKFDDGSVRVFLHHSSLPFAG